jgi:hypothetical protein
MGWGGGGVGEKKVDRICRIVESKNADGLICTPKGTEPQVTIHVNAQELFHSTCHH